MLHVFLFNQININKLTHTNLGQVVNKNMSGCYASVFLAKILYFKLSFVVCCVLSVPVGYLKGFIHKSQTVGGMGGSLRARG